jgi:diguanylate cyclase (GGDEF)-like protein
MAVVFAASGLVVLARAWKRPAERLAWTFLGVGLVVFGCGGVAYNVLPASANFPAIADLLWMSMYPFAFVCLVMLTRARFTHVEFALWLDAAIAATGAAAAVAAVAFGSAYDTASTHAGASIGLLAYPTFDAICLALLTAVWSLGGRRLEGFWWLIVSAFCLLAVADVLWVVQAARGEWVPGTLLDLPYMAAVGLLAAAAWKAPTVRPERAQPGQPPVALPVACGAIALVIIAWAALWQMNPVATALAFVTLIAVVIRSAVALSSLTRQRAQLSALAATDPLTGLANHRALHEHLEREVARARQTGGAVAVVALDLDHFKRVNDTYGHTQGDVMLRAVAARLLEEIRPQDRVGRIGGEEFTLVLPGTTPEQAFTIADRCRRAVEDVWSDGIRVGCSAGVASFPKDDSEGTRLMEMADSALYLAKRSGRGRTHRFERDQVNLLSSAEQHAQVQALLEDRTLLTPVFQPIVELATGRIAGYEALARFPHTTPIRPPDVWFEQARRCGLGPELEARSIELALATPGRPENTFLTVNVSPAALISDSVALVLPYDLSGIVIEVTENELFTSDERLELALDEMRARGARIALDDAGAGYAGLQQLVRIKPDMLKLDRSLIRGLQRDPAKIALLDALAKFASTTGAAVCAEGVEDLGELLTLARFDVTYAQGFSLARPAPNWPGVAAQVAETVAADVRAGVRVTPELPAGEHGPVTLGQVTGAIARARSRHEIDTAVALMERLIHSEDVAVSIYVPEHRYVETLSEHPDWDGAGRPFLLDDYPTTEYVLEHQEIGQLIAGDPAADPAEVELLAEGGFRAVMLAPVIHRGATVGLLEIYRREARPWSPTEVDQARVFAHHLGTLLWEDRDIVARPPRTWAARDGSPAGAPDA